MDRVGRIVWFHRGCAVVWALLLIPALLFWPDSVAFVIIASVYANVKSDWGAAEAADDHRVLARIDRIEQLLGGECPGCRGGRRDGGEEASGLGKLDEA